MKLTIILFGILISSVATANPPPPPNIPNPTACLSRASNEALLAELGGRLRGVPGSQATVVEITSRVDLDCIGKVNGSTNGFINRDLALVTQFSKQCRDTPAGQCKLVISRNSTKCFDTLNAILNSFISRDANVVSALSNICKDEVYQCSF